MNSISDVIKAINNSNKIGIFTHVSLDGDAIGSSISLYHALKEMGKEVYVTLDEVPKCFDFLIDGIEINNCSDVDLVICVDSASRSRVYTNGYEIDSVRVINIDHHASNPLWGDINYVITDVSSNCENLFEIIECLGFINNKSIADSLCCGIITDSGAFRYSGVTDKTFDIMSKLYKLGIDIEGIYYKVFDSKRYEQMELYKIAISRVAYSFDRRVSYSYLYNDDFIKTNSSAGDHEGIVSEIKNVDTVLISFFIREDKDGTFKVSLRSKENIDVSKIASLYDGGGHKNAAGCTISGSVNEVINKLLGSIGEVCGWNNSFK